MRNAEGCRSGQNPQRGDKKICDKSILSLAVVVTGCRVFQKAFVLVTRRKMFKKPGYPENGNETRMSVENSVSKSVLQATQYNANGTCIDVLGWIVRGLQTAYS